MSASKIFILVLLFSSNAFSDMEHYKDVLIGGRAATMGGAYTGVSDDASGSFYNPAGLNFANMSSFSGSANTYTINKTKYQKAIGDRDWDRDSSNLMPNFFGVVQKGKDSAFGFSYAVVNSKIEHQDQIYEYISEVSNPLNVYALNIHSEDNTYHIGPSYSKKFSDEFTFGATLYYHYRVYRRAQSQLLRYSDGTDESTYLNTLKKEKGFMPKLGVMWTPKDKWSMGATLAHTQVIASITDNQQNKKNKGASTFQFGQNADTVKRKMPYELSIGTAYFPSPYVLYSFDVDYYLPTDGSQVDVINFSMGSEYFLNETNAIRGGVYTNRSNSKQPSKNTVAPLEKIHYYGATVGYTMYSKSSAITLGTIYSTGEGDAQIYTGSSAIKKYESTSYRFIIAADYGF